VKLRACLDMSCNGVADDCAAWCDVVLCCAVCCGMVCLVWNYGAMLCGVVMCELFKLAWCCCVSWCGLVLNMWYGVVRVNVMRCGVAWCGVVLCYVL